jgi:hypothetical protein
MNKFISITLLATSLLSSLANANDEDLATEVANTSQSSYVQVQNTVPSVKAYESIHSQESYAGEDQATIALIKTSEVNLKNKIAVTFTNNTEFPHYLNILEDKATNVASLN